MIYWGWIPHLYPSFDMKFSKELFGEMISYLNGYHLHSNDDDSEESILLSIENKKEFEYDDECIKFSISNGEEIAYPFITVYRTGLLKFDMRESNEIYQHHESDKIRYVVRELYFAIKKLFHTDVHHKSDGIGSKEMKYGDDNFSIVEAETESEALKKLFSLIIRKCENGLERYSRLNMNDVDSDETMYSMMAGFITYGNNFLNVFEKPLSDCIESYRGSLESCRISLKSIDHASYNQSDREIKRRTDDLNKQMLQINNKMLKINDRMMWLTILSIAVAFFAGSLLADSITHISVSIKWILIVIAGIVTAYSAYHIWKKTNDEPKSN